MYLLWLIITLIEIDLRVEEWWMGQDMRVWSLDLNERLMYLSFEIISDVKVVLDVLVRLIRFGCVVYVLNWHIELEVDIA